MKAIFEYKGEETELKIPKSLMYINWLLEETELESNWIWYDSLDYVTNKLCKIFAKEKGMDKNKIYAELLQPKDGSEAPFGVKISDDIY